MEIWTNKWIMTAMHDTVQIHSSTNQRWLYPWAPLRSFYEIITNNQIEQWISRWFKLRQLSVFHRANFMVVWQKPAEIKLILWGQFISDIPTEHKMPFVVSSRMIGLSKWLVGDLKCDLCELSNDPIFMVTWRKLSEIQLMMWQLFVSDIPTDAKHLLSYNHN